MASKWTRIMFDNGVWRGIESYTNGDFMIKVEYGMRSKPIGYSLFHKGNEIGSYQTLSEAKERAAKISQV